MDRTSEGDASPPAESPYCVVMDPSRKRKTRLVVALTCAVTLAAALVYTSFSAASEARQPSQLRGAEAGKTYQLTGRVAPGSWDHKGAVHTFRVEDRDGGGPTVAVRYVGQVPDPFREGREIVIDVKRQGAAFEGHLVTSESGWPSKTAPCLRTSITTSRPSRNGSGTWPT